MTRLLRETMEEWAGQAEVPHDLADRALRGRSWKPAVAAALALAVAVAVFAVVLTGGPTTVRPADGIMLPPRPSPAPTDVRGDPDHNRPTKLVAAGNVAVSAYYTHGQESLGGDRVRLRRTWWLYDPRTDTYERTPYAWVDVAPGMQVAAVLEGDGLGRRAGILDMNTRQFLTWIDLGHDVASLTWSPDGTKLLATSYAEYPDTWEENGPNSRLLFDSTRLGYVIADVPARTVEYHAKPALTGAPDDPQPGNHNSRQDLGWSLDGSLIWEPLDTKPGRIYYSPGGQRQDPPPDLVSHGGLSRVSPDGRLLLGEPGLPTSITDRDTGAVVGSQEVLQLLAWADNEHVLALGCAGTCGNEFRNALVLVSVDGKEVVQLTGNRDSRTEEEGWQWVLTPR
ncbi:hypothetical protein [Nonomuraea sp. SBT364]|uniref:hypothetical protein n=1 Tax=Nonomuraea sp. SBT364 TaxID=1580530 RepID=UPI00066B348E|nr:hypothetical protein [Nonomuraea sp. SBT364]